MYNTARAVCAQPQKQSAFAVGHGHGFPGADGGRRRYPGRRSLTNRHRLTLRRDDVEVEVSPVWGDGEDLVLFRLTAIEAGTLFGKGLSALKCWTARSLNFPGGSVLTSKLNYSSTGQQRIPCRRPFFLHFLVAGVLAESALLVPMPLPRAYRDETYVGVSVAWCSSAEHKQPRRGGVS